ncbi:MAG: sigma-54-dependent transcriptional regulator [Vicinamibacterales bacterium]
MSSVPPEKPRVLVVDDEPSLREIISIALRRDGYDVTTADNVGAALDQIRRGPPPDVLISDLRMPDGSGVDVLRALKERSPGSVGLLLTAFASADTAVEAMRLGAVDYLTKPFDVADLKQRVARYLEAKRLNEMQQAPVEGRKSPGFVLAGRSRQILDVISLVARVARTDASVLITGESGTGKEWTAREIHLQSARQAQPFVAVNCGAFTESILESELFGHMKGSFTGAVDTKKGLLETADHGTLFLDEVGETSLGMQVKLLRVLQERRFRRVGGTQELEADVRFIAATNRNLEEMVRSGTFREDFFFRINVISVQLPALRERAEDIPILAEQFLQRFAERMGRPVRGIGGDTMRLLMAYRWPGNVRELENVMERGVALEQSAELTPESLPPHLRETPAAAGGPAAVEAIPPTGFNLEAHLQQIERMHLERALKQAGGVQVKAADLLGITFRQFRYLAKKYQLK